MRFGPHQAVDSILVGTPTGGFKMRKVLSLGVSAMALAALATVSTGCTGDDDDAGSLPGGIVNISVGAAGATSSSSFAQASGNYAEFYSDYEGEVVTFRDVPLDGACINPLNPPAGGTPVYADHTSVDFVSGATTIALTADDPGFYLASNVPGAPNGADYTVNVDGAALGTVTVPPGPGTVTVTGDNTVTWTSMNADDVFIVFIAADFSSVNLCHTADDGSYDFSALSLTSGYATVSGANYSEASLDGRDVILIGAGDIANDPPAIF